MMWQILKWVAALYILLLFVGLLAPRMVLHDGKRTRGRVIKVYGLGAIGALMLLGMFAPDAEDAQGDIQASSSNALAASSSSAESDAASGALLQKVSLRADAAVASDETLKKKLSNLRRDVQLNWVAKDKNGKYRVAVTYAPKSIWSERSYLTSLGDVLVTYGKTARDSGVEISDLVVNGRGPVVDQYGNEESAEFLTITVPEADFAQINWKNITHWRALEIADVQFRPVGRKAAIEFCKDESNAKYSPTFCRAADTGKRKAALSASMIQTNLAPATEGKSAEDSKSVESKAVKPLNLDVTTFQKRVNNDFKQAKISYRVPEGIRLEGEALAPRKTASVHFNKYLSAVVAAEPKSGKLVSILAISRPNEDASNVFDDVMASILIASAAAGRDGEKQVGGEILRMFNRVMDTFSSQVASARAQESFDKNGVRYSVVVSKQLGIWISAESI